MLWSPIKDASISVQEEQNKLDTHSEALLIHRQTRDSIALSLAGVWLQSYRVLTLLDKKVILPCNAVTILAVTVRNPHFAHTLYLCISLFLKIPVPVTASSKAWVYSRSPAEIDGSNPARGHGCLSVESVVCCWVEVSATSWSLIQGSPTNCGASLLVYDLNSSKNGAAMALVGP
jgi:hypothetical protein